MRVSLFTFGLICGMQGIANGEPRGWAPSSVFPLMEESLAISRGAQPRLPFSVSGERGGIFGQQDGSWESWQFPVKLISHVRLEVMLNDYPVPVALNELAAAIQVQPGRTSITYSHAAFTIKQHMFAARDSAPDAPAIVVFYEIASSRPLTLTIRFTAEMLRMWPAANFGRPGAEWVTLGSSGYYLLHTDNNDFVGGIGMPGTLPGVLPPYQERPRTWPLELRLTFDPKKQGRLFFPLLMIAGKDAKAVGQQIQVWNSTWDDTYRKTQEYYANFSRSRVTVHTPNPNFDLAIKWAEIAIDQCRANYQDEIGLTAGYYSSADSARPGFGWFFGRDALFTLYAVNTYGDWQLSRAALEFLIHRQRGDGKIMHEYSQAANLVDWSATPYFYAAADSTPMFIMTMADYLRWSGDTNFVRTHWEAIRKAWTFLRSHDSDGDGIYENTEGTGWVESWPTGMPHQEIYLAALDRQACDALSALATAIGDTALATSAKTQGDSIASKIESEYYQPETKLYAFSRNAGGSLDQTVTVFPAVAWWDGTFGLKQAGPMLARWASQEFSTDWGLRDISPQTSFYDPISYHQGSVWPLYAGWEAIAQYRSGNAAAGFASLMHNANQTFTQDLGFVTELLSGEFFEPLGRSTPHQLWSSAMVLTPALRGLFGITANAQTRTLRLNPQLPASWDRAEVENLSLGVSRFDLRLTRKGGVVEVSLTSKSGDLPCIEAQEAVSAVPCGARTIQIALPPVEIEPDTSLPVPGSVTAGIKVLSRAVEAHRTVFEVAAPGGTIARLKVRANRAAVRLEGGEMSGQVVQITFPAADGYTRKELVFRY